MTVPSKTYPVADVYPYTSAISISAAVPPLKGLRVVITTTPPAGLKTSSPRLKSGAATARLRASIRLEPSDRLEHIRREAVQKPYLALITREKNIRDTQILERGQ